MSFYVGLSVFLGLGLIAMNCDTEKHKKEVEQLADENDRLKKELDSLQEEIEELEEELDDERGARILHEKRADHAEADVRHKDEIIVTSLVCGVLSMIIGAIISLTVIIPVQRAALTN